MKIITVLFLLLFNVDTAYSSGWNDYSLEIAPGFKIFRPNSFDIGLGESNGHGLLRPLDYPGKVGPLVGYLVTPEYIFTRHLGAKKPDKDRSVPEIDPDVEYFFIVSRSVKVVYGPFTAKEFAADNRHPATPITWVEPENPNFWRPVLGGFFFLVISAFVLGWPLLVVIAVVQLFLYFRRRSRNKDNSTSVESSYKQ